MIDKEKLRLNLSNFYAEHGYEGINIDFFIDKYIETGQAIEEYLRQVKSNQTLKSMEVFRKYNFAAFKGHKACYDLESLLMRTSNATALGLSGSFSERKTQWENISDDIKADFLNSQGLYIELSAKRNYDDVNPEIVSLDLTDLSKRSLVEGIDYLLKNNKIYLIGDSAVAGYENSDLIATNIFVDYDTPNRLLGSRIGVGYNSNITKSEYKDFIVMVAYALIKGPTIKNLKEAFDVLIGWEGSEINDKYKATGVRKEMWDNSETAILTPFDFLVTIPASLISTVGLDETGKIVSSGDRLDVFRSFLNVVKPIDTDYILALSENILDVLSLNDNITERTRFSTEDFSDPISDIHNIPTVKPESDLVHGALYLNINYDDGEYYDSENTYDKDMLESGEKTYGDLMDLKYIEYPQFPVDFDASMSLMTGVVNITFKDNAEDVSGYVIRRDEEIIATLDSSGDNSEISYSDYEARDLPGGKYIYYAQSYYTIQDDIIYSRKSKNKTINK